MSGGRSARRGVRRRPTQGGCTTFLRSSFLDGLREWSINSCPRKIRILKKADFSDIIDLTEYLPGAKCPADRKFRKKGGDRQRETFSAGNQSIFNLNGIKENKNHDRQGKKGDLYRGHCDHFGCADRRQRGRRHVRRHHHQCLQRGFDRLQRRRDAAGIGSRHCSRATSSSALWRRTASCSSKTRRIRTASPPCP